MRPLALTCPGTHASCCAWIVSCSDSLQLQLSSQLLQLCWGLRLHHLRQVLPGLALGAAPQLVVVWEGLLSRRPAPVSYRRSARCCHACPRPPLLLRRGCSQTLGCRHALWLCLRWFQSLR